MRATTTYLLNEKLSSAAHSGPDLPKMLRNLKIDEIVMDMGYDVSKMFLAKI